MARAKKKAAGKKARAAKKAKPTAKRRAKKARKKARSAPGKERQAQPLPRAAKGKRPQYFEDPAVDKLHLMVMALIEELSVTRDRLDTMERLIEKHGLFKIDEIEDYVPDLRADAERTQRRIAFIRRVMKGVTDEIENLRSADPALEFDEVVDVVSR